MPSSLDDSIVGLVGLEDIQDGGRGGITVRPTNPFDIDSLKTRFKIGDILYGKLRPYLNKVGIAQSDGICSTEIWAFTTEPFLDARFAAYYIASSFFVDRVASLTKGANLPRLDSVSFDTISIPLPPLSEQKRIVDILQEAEEIRRLRSQATAKTSELIPAIFYHHFKKELCSPRAHASRLAGFCVNDEAVKCGPFGTQLRQDEFTRQGIPLWGIKHVNSNFQKQTDEFISAEKADELSSYSLLPGDIVMTRKGTIGNCAIYPDHFPPGIMHSDLLRIRLDTSRFNPVFLSSQLALSPFVEKQIASQSAGAVMPGINVTRLKELKLFVVERDRQELFANEVQQISEILDMDHQSLSHEGQMLSSLSAHAFTGQLTEDWREKHEKKLAAEARDRDAALQKAGVAHPLSQRATMQKMDAVRDDRTDCIYAELNIEQRGLFSEIERMVGRVDYGRYFTAEQLAVDLKGPLHRHPQAIESHLAVFTVRGLVIPVSRPRNDSTGDHFAACYRLPLKEDDVRPERLEHQRKLAVGDV